MGVGDTISEGVKKEGHEPHHKITEVKMYWCKKFYVL